MMTPIPDEVLRQIRQPMPGSCGPVGLCCVTGVGLDSLVYALDTRDLARELLACREALRGFLGPCPVEVETSRRMVCAARALLPEYASKEEPK